MKEGTERGTCVTERGADLDEMASSHTSSGEGWSSRGDSQGACVRGGGPALGERPLCDNSIFVALYGHIPQLVAARKVSLADMLKVRYKNSSARK